MSHARRNENSSAGSKRSFLDRRCLEECLELAKRHMAAVDASQEELSRQQEAGRCRVEREREAKLQSALHALNILEKAKKPNEIKPAHVSLSDPDAGFMRHGGKRSIASANCWASPSYNVQFTKRRRLFSGQII
ncbi:MAG: hypothetical protein DMG96_28460 [Acidobacteria bacterium]|nr:MAG: hypothetical protein DMG96_28460 [Acidobacteriota bacterium]